jgi:predicted nucleic acid-binding protein
VIVVDTSVWIAALRQPGCVEAEILRGLIDADLVAMPAPVRTELLMGAAGATRARLANNLSALPLLYPSDDTWHTIDAWTARASERGERFGLGDLLVGVLASDQGALVWSLDRDLQRMGELGLVHLYR